MFAAFNVEIDYPKWDQMLQYVELWLRKAGIGAVVVLFIWLLWFILKAALRDGKWVPYGLTGRLDTTGETNNWRVRLFWVMLAITGAAIIGGIAFYLYKIIYSDTLIDLFDLPDPANRTHSTRNLSDYLINIFCGLALFTLSLEFLFDVFRFSPRRLIAITRFSIKEAVRRKVLWSFLLLGLVVLFASWFITTEKKDDQWRQYVNLVFFVVSAMVLVMSGILACFSLPTDIKQQTIFTVVTKPVQKLEIVVGRIFGIVLLMTLILAIAGAVSLVYIARGVDPEVKRQASRARGIETGNIKFFQLAENGQVVETGRLDMIGREWEYFSYLRGGSSQEAVWYFPGITKALEGKDRVRVECTFDIFRTSKGGLDRFAQGVSAQFWFINRSKWRGDFDELRGAIDPATRQPLSAEQKAKKFGYYELPQPIVVFDEGEPSAFTFPAGIMDDSPPNAVLEVHLSCRSPNQYLGTAANNLYLLVAEKNWVVNYFKGLTGIWFYMVLITTIGVVLSTYLNAPVSMMVTVLLILAGQPRVLSYINDLALPEDEINRPGGSTAQSFYRLMEKRNLVAPLGDSPVVKAARFIDNYVFRYLFKMVYAVLPDVAIYDRALFVAEGFDIPPNELGATLVHLLLYLFPFLLLGYYLLTGRELAN
jgi:ABC-type transport system involved in multi-copper enzyme maturation permease subunit